MAVTKTSVPAKTSVPTLTPVPAKTSFDSIRDFFKEAIGDAQNNSWNPVIFFGILLIATMPFVNQQKLIFVGYILLAALYLVIFINIIHGAFKKGVYEKIKGVLSNPYVNPLFTIPAIPLVGALSLGLTSFGFVKFAFMLFFIIINTMSWISSPKKGDGGNIWGAVLTSFAPIVLYFGMNHFIGGKLDDIDIFKTTLFFITVGAFIGLLIYNFVSLTQVLTTLSDRSKQMRSYNLRVSKQRMDELNGYSVSVYLAIITSMYIINDSTTSASDNIYPKKSSFIPVFIAYLLFTSATIANYFNLRKIVPGLKYDSTKIIRKTPDQNAKEASEQKVQNQNVLTTAYYSILNFFNPANL